MSTDQMHEATGRLVHEYRESRGKVALLQNEISRHAKAYAAIVEGLDDLVSDEATIGVPGVIPVSPWDTLKSALHEIPTAENILSICSELRDETSRFTELERRKKALDI